MAGVHYNDISETMGDLKLEKYEDKPENKPVSKRYPWGEFKKEAQESRFDGALIGTKVVDGYGEITKATTTNPKDLLGDKKVPIGEVCPVAMLHESCAMLDGDLKYGFRNWREKDVKARIYIDAALRHISAWAEMEEYAEDSGVHHLGHARACLGILLDAQECGNLIDDRAKGVFAKVSERLQAWVQERRKKHAETGK